MGPIIIIVAALAAFAIGGAAVVLATAWRRTERHNAALLNAHARIAQLERMMAALTFGETPAPADLPPAPQPVRASETPAVSPPIERQGDEAIAARVVVSPSPSRFAHAASAVSPWLPLIGCALVAIAIGAARAAPGGLLPVAAILCAFLLACAAIGFARRFGSSLMWLGLGVGLAAPLLGPFDASTALARAGGLVALVGIIMQSAARYPRAVWIAFCGAFAWSFASALMPGPPMQIAFSGVCAAALGALALVFAWDDGGAPLAFAFPSWALVKHPPRALVLAYGGVIAACAILACLVMRNPDAAGPAAFSLLLLTAFCGFVAAYRPALSAAPVLPALAGAGALLLWPASADRSALLFVAGALSGVALCAGALMLMRGQRVGAALSGLGPIVFLVAAQARGASLAQPWAWAGAAIGAGALCAAGFFRLRRALPDAALFLAMGAALAAVAAIGFLIPAPWPPLAVALALPTIAWLGAREPGLRAAAIVLAWFLLAQIAATHLGPAPLAIRIAIAGCAALAAYFSARRLAEHDPEWLSGQLVYVAAVLIPAIATSLETWRALGAGPQTLLADCGVQTLIGLTAAYILAREFGPKPHPLIQAVEAAFLGAAAAAALVVGGIVINPWWGWAATAAPGWPGFNALSLAFLAPAIGFCLYAWLRRWQHMRTRPKLALGVGLTLALLYLVLELRRAYHGAAMAEGAVTAGEGWAYVIGLLGFAAALLVLAIERGGLILRYASLSLALLALAKAALFDLGAFHGAAQIGMLGALAAAGAGLVLIYRRFVLPWRPRPAKTLGDPNLTPPT